MQKLEHVNLVVSEIDPIVNFVTAAFPTWRVRGSGNQPFAGMERRWLHVGDDQDYLALTEYHLPPEEKGEPRDLSSPAPGLAHLGFEVSSIDEIVERLGKAGYEPSTWGADHPQRRRVYFIEGDNIEFEFIEYFSDKAEERNSYED